MESQTQHSPEQQMFAARSDLSGLHMAVERIRGEIGKVIVGQHQMVELLIAAMLADGHVLIEGVPGVAKTLAAKLVARTISVDFSRLQFTPDLMPSDVLGTSVFNPKTTEFEFRRGPIFSNIILIDEINRAPAKTQSALFEVMEERQVTVDGKTMAMEAPFLVIATQNPIEQEGTYRLPEAQLDRFLFKINVGYPTLEEEVSIIAGHHEKKHDQRVDDINTVLTGRDMALYRQQTRSLHIDKNLMNYIAQIVHRTRGNSSLYLGGSPRASLALLNGAKAMAAMRGRDFVTPEDIKDIAAPVLRHRIMLTPEKEMEGARTDDVILHIVDGIEIPR